MSKLLVNECEDVAWSKPPAYSEAVQGGSANQELSYPKQEGNLSAGKPDGNLPPGVPALLAMPVPLRDVGVGGNVVYVVNQSEASDTGIEGESPFGASFGNKAVRAAFVRKVYSILMAQLLTTVIFIAWFMFHDATRNFVRQNVILLIVAYVTFLVTYIILVCCSSVRRTWPCNIIMLSIFTLAMSYWAAIISAFHDTLVVLLTVGIVSVVCLGLTLFSIQTKWDITGAGIYLFVFLLVVVLFGVVALVVTITTGSTIMNVVYSGLLALVFSMYLVYDTQQIIGNRKVQLSAEEHIFGALQLYMDIIYLYLAVLSLSSNSCK
ncbi:protein lifeguard 2-like [Periplaneta americana]|uniref:protein lifeguard 2-like n=1 Tax=Periplaneta americana TaxID=6978 RepID=UPI0037E9746B